MNCIKLSLYLIIFVFCSNIYSLDKEGFQHFSIEYSNRGTNERSWSEFIFAVENEYDDIAVFFAGKNQKTTYEFEVKKRVAANGFKFNECFYRNAIISLVRSSKVAVLDKILKLVHVDSVYEYSLAAGKEQEKLYAIHVAIENNENSLELVKILVENGADVNQVSYKVFWNWGNINPYNQERRMRVTPLYIATQEEKFDVIEYLVNNGADVRDGAYHTLNLAISKNRLDIVALLIENGCNGLSGVLSTAIGSNNIEAVSMLINHGAKPKVDHISQALKLGFYEIADLLTDVMVG